MALLMSGHKLQICLFFFDDIIVWSSDVEGRLIRLREVVERLKSDRLKLKPSKCRLFQKSVTFLGHIVSVDGIATDPVKIEIVAIWPVPTCLRELRSFVDLCNYCRRFVEGFAERATTLHMLTGKGMTFERTQSRCIRCRVVSCHHEGETRNPERKDGRPSVSRIDLRMRRDSDRPTRPDRL